MAIKHKTQFILDGIAQNRIHKLKKKTILKLCTISEFCHRVNEICLDCMRSDRHVITKCW